jgi:hypothetical protein
MVKTSVTRVFFRIVKRCDKRVPATIGGSTERLQGTGRAQWGHGPSDRSACSAWSRLQAVRAYRRPLRPQVPNRAVNIVAMLAACTTAWRLCVEPPRAHGLRSHSCSWFDPQTPPTAGPWRRLRPLRNVAVAVAVGSRTPNRSVRMNYSQDVAGTTCLSVQDRL